MTARVREYLRLRQAWLDNWPADLVEKYRQFLQLVGIGETSVALSDTEVAYAQKHEHILLG